GTTNSIVAGNYVGLAADGVTAVPNQAGGIGIDQGANHNLIGGGSTPAARNVISGNTGAGIIITGTGSDYNLVQGNYIGTDSTGAVAVGNTPAQGVAITLGAQHNVIGTDGDGTNDATEGNVISGNTGDGIDIEFGSGNNFNVIAGNLIGTD